MITLQDTIARMKRGIIEDIGELLVPVNVKNFAELHDFVDANAYGGLCDEEALKEIATQFGGRDAEGGMPQGAVDYMNAAQNEVSKWIEGGGAGLKFELQPIEVLGAQLKRLAPFIRKGKKLERLLGEAVHLIEQLAVSNSNELYGCRPSWCDLVSDAKSAMQS